jgi:hypothetical protein
MTAKRIKNEARKAKIARDVRKRLLQETLAKGAFEDYFDVIHLYAGLSANAKSCAACARILFQARRGLSPASGRGGTGDEKT